MRRALRPLPRSMESNVEAELDNVAILDEVRKHGFAGNVTVEYEHNWKTNLPEVAQCVGYLRAYSKMRAS